MAFHRIHFLANETPSSKSLNHFFNKPSSKYNKKALVVGISKGSKDFTHLPSVTKEIDVVQQILKAENYDVAKLHNEQASLDAIQNTIESGISHVHIASHGFFEYKKPSSTGIVLHNDEVLSIAHILEMDALRDVAFLCLSSCWAADQYVLPGRWIVSLPEVLRKAGVGTILGCLWEVHDRVGAAFMETFYTYAVKYPKVIALQKTQADALHNRLGIAGIDTSAPFFWAGFTLYH
jgi:CHAT domain-containing protein